MIDKEALLSDLKGQLRSLEADMLERAEADAAIKQHLSEEYNNAKSAKRTGLSFSVWRDDYITQAAVAWILSCVFIRFVEDNRLIKTALISGPGERWQEAKDERQLYFRDFPTNSDRDYLEHVFAGAAKLPALRELFDRRHNALWLLGPSGDGAKELLAFFQSRDEATGALRHDFSAAAWDTRFLGDLYQDLSETAKKKYALLQTPDFVEEFILDRTLEPALAEFGYQKVKLLDPTCGSGHFLLGAFARLLRCFQENQPGLNERERVQQALNGVYGVDINTFAVAIARFRLLVAALQASGVERLEAAPAFRLNLATGDSLLHGPRWLDSSPTTAGSRQEMLLGSHPLVHVYETEDAAELQRILGQQYEAVVGNPPYITVKDPSLNEAYRERYGSCHRQYSLAVPFMERFFELTRGEGDADSGFVGMITSNSFMKREFGKKLIEEYISKWDLSHVLDTSGAYIPGHGTPTVIIFGRNRQPRLSTVRAVLGIRGEPSTPADPAQGQVWRAIVENLDQAGFENDFVSVVDHPRERFAKHPWSLGGGGASDLRRQLELSDSKSLESFVKEIGFGVVTREDDVFRISANVALRRGVAAEFVAPLVAGEEVRDWLIDNPVQGIWPYDRASLEVVAHEGVVRFLWPWKRQLSERVAYGMTQIGRGLQWFEYSMFFEDRFRTPLSIAFAFVASHNHFVLDRGGKVFNRTAPVIKLRTGATEDEHLALLGLLNSSVACFWGRQTFFPRGGFAAGKWEERLEWDGTKLQQFPVPKERPLALAKELDHLGQKLGALEPSCVFAKQAPTKEVLAKIESEHSELFAKLLSLQEELDWGCYKHYGLLDEAYCLPAGEAPLIKQGERAFEILMAQKLGTESGDRAWFERNGATPTPSIPEFWPAKYRELVAKRMELIGSDHSIGLIERPEHKRRYARESWDSKVKSALSEWLLDRLEDNKFWSRVALLSTAKLADSLRSDSEFLTALELYTGSIAFDLEREVARLVDQAAVPALCNCRYKENGLRKRKEWESVWELQRQEDAITARTKLAPGDPLYLSESQAKELAAKEVGDIPVPPKYAAGDFQSGVYWSLRGKLDVPKERFVSFPLCERDADPTLVIGWAGWNHLELARAIAEYYTDRRDNEGWAPERLVPLLAALAEQIPWLKQWHNELDPEFNLRMGDYFAGFVEEQARYLNMTVAELKEWAPAVRGRRRKA